jgi:hypothetical protein
VFAARLREVQQTPRTGADKAARIGRN